MRHASTLPFVDLCKKKLDIPSSNPVLFRMMFLLSSYADPTEVEKFIAHLMCDICGTTCENARACPWTQGLASVDFA